MSGVVVTSTKSNVKRKEFSCVKSIYYVHTLVHYPFKIQLVLGSWKISGI